MRRLSISIAVLAAACSKGGTTTRTYQLHDAGDPAAPAIPLRASAPADLAEEVDKLGNVTLTPSSSAQVPSVDIRRADCRDGTEGAACIERRVKLAIGEDGKVERRTVGAATWIHVVAGDHGSPADVRYVFDAPTRSLVECTVLAGKGGDPAPLRAICDSIVVRP